jgi:hypothetical protein
VPAEHDERDSDSDATHGHGIRYQQEAL